MASSIASDDRANAHTHGTEAGPSEHTAEAFESAGLPSRSRAGVVWAAAGLLGVSAIASSFLSRGSDGGPEQSSATAALVHDNPAPHPELAGLAAPQHERTPEEVMRDRVLHDSPSPGWHWAIKPQALPEHNQGDIKFVRLAFVKPEAQDGPEASVPRPWRMEPDQLVIPITRETDATYQLVAFDSKGERTDINIKTRDPNSFGFFVTRVPDVQWIGFQAGNPEQLAKISQGAVEEAKSLGVPVLSTGKLGEQYDFSLTDVNGKTITQKDFSGKVVVMLEWATWCGSCHVTMRELFPLLKPLGDKVQLVMIDHDAKDRLEMARHEMEGFPKGTVNIALASFVGSNGQSPKDMDKMWALARKGVNSYGIPTVVIVGRDGSLVMDATSPSTQRLQTTIMQAVESEPQTAQGQTAQNQGR